MATEQVKKLHAVLETIRKRSADRRMTYSDGGPGSGNHGHAGRPGKRGGSAPGNFKSMGTTCTERMAFRNKMSADCRSKLEQNDDTYIDKKVAFSEAKRQLKRCDDDLEKLKPLEGVTLENFPYKQLEYWQKYETARKLERSAYNQMCMTKKKADKDAWKAAQEAANKAYDDHEKFNWDPELALKKRDDLKAKRTELQSQYDQAKKELDEVEQEQQKYIAAYKKDLDQMNKAIIKKYYKQGGPKTLDEATEYLTAKGYFDNSVRDVGSARPLGSPSFWPAVDLSGCDPDLVVSASKAIHKVYKKFPDMSGFAQCLSADDGIREDRTMALYRHHEEDTGGELLINTRHFTKATKGKGYSFDGSFHPLIKSSSPYYAHDAVITHELGHTLDGFLCSKHKEIAEEYTEKVRGEECKGWSVANPILKQAAKNLGMSVTTLKQNVSAYACKNPRETLAEAFAEYMVSDTPRPAAAEIGRQIYSLYSTGKLAGKART